MWVIGHPTSVLRNIPHSGLKSHSCFPAFLNRKKLAVLLFRKKNYMILLCNAVTSPQCFLEDPKTFIKSQSYDLDWIYGQL